jgi:hypothetical protein
MRQAQRTLRATLDREWQERLHSMPLLQCLCGEILNSVRCHCPYPTAPHAPETMQGYCNVCRHQATEEP